MAGVRGKERGRRAEGREGGREGGVYSERGGRGGGKDAFNLGVRWRWAGEEDEVKGELEGEASGG